MESLKKGKIEEFNIYSEDVEEILTSTPSSLYYIGNSIIAAILLLLLFLSWLIKFPVIVNTAAYITSGETPVKLISQTTGNLMKLQVAEGELVEKGEVLAIISTNTNYDDIIKLKAILAQVKTNIETDNHGEIEFSADLRIGGMSDIYAQLISSYHRFHVVTTKFSIAREEREIQNQLIDINKMIVLLREEQAYSQKQLDLIANNYERQVGLYNSGVISEADLEQSDYELNQHEIEVNRLKYRIQDLNSSKNGLKRQQEALKTTDLRNTSNLQLEILALIEQMTGQIKSWESQHLVTAPFAGKCSFVSFLEQNQFISLNQELFYISPNANDFEVRGVLPIEKSGLISPDQKVILKLRSYPYKEYGILTARVENISYVANEQGYIYFAKLENGLETSYNTVVDYSPLMQADAEIIVEDARLIERIFNEIRNIFKN